MQLGFAIVANDDLHNLMRRLQLEIAERWGPNPALKQTPHITIKQPFHAKALPPIEDYFDALVRTTAPITLRLAGIGAFEDDKVIFLAVDPHPGLEAMRQRVLRDLRERFGVKPRDIEDERYRFHASLTWGLSADHFDQAWAALRDRRIELEFRLETLGLFYYTGEDWIPYKRSSLSLDSARPQLVEGPPHGSTGSP